MLSKNTKKVQFTLGNDFSLSGNDYTGYFNIFEKNALLMAARDNTFGSTITST